MADFDRHTRNGARTSNPYDNVLTCLRDLFYQLIMEGTVPTHLLTGVPVLMWFEAEAKQLDPVITFKHVPVLLDPGMPKDQIDLMQGRRLVGRIDRIS